MRAKEPAVLALHRRKVIAMVPAPMPPENAVSEPLDAIPVLRTWVRGSLVVIAAALIAVFSVAIWINPYDASGMPKSMATHTQLGLPNCTFYQMTGRPCPSCGMTTSFSLLMHGDIWNSMKANAVGTLLALFCLALIPWSLFGVVMGRPLFITAIEPVLTRIVIVFMVLMMVRWVIVLASYGFQPWH